MKRVLTILCLLSTLLVTMPLSAQAQSDSYAITWFTLSAGGTSANSEYQLAGSAGQSEAGMSTMSGGEFALDGGLWGGEKMQQKVFLPVVA